MVLYRSPNEEQIFVNQKLKEGEESPTKIKPKENQVVKIFFLISC